MPIFQRVSLITFLNFILPLFLGTIIAAYHEIMATKPSNHHLNGMFLPAWSWSLKEGFLDIYLEAVHVQEMQLLIHYFNLQSSKSPSPSSPNNP